MKLLPCVALLVVALISGLVAEVPLQVDDFLAPAYPFGLVAAAKAERIAWIAYERGRRNVYTASAPGFRPIRLTNNLKDDGTDLTDLAISDDGSMLVFVRGHAPNRDGWVANPASDPAGAQRTIWEIRTSGGPARQLAEGGAPALSPDGAHVLYVKDGQIYQVNTSKAAAMKPATSRAASTSAEKPLITAFGENGNPLWSPDSTRVAFVSDRSDHALIGVYDVRTRKVLYVSPSVDHDGSPTWSAGGKRLAFIRRPGTPFGPQLEQVAQGRGRGRGSQGGRGAFGRGTQEEGPSIPGLTRAMFTGGYTIAFMVADIPPAGSVTTNLGDRTGDSPAGAAREFWHNQKDDRGFNRIDAIRWAGDSIIFQAEPEEWIRYYSVPVEGTVSAPVQLTPGDGMVETTALSADGRHLFYSTNAGDLDRRDVWKVPTAGGRAVQITSGSAIETYPAAMASGKRVALLTAAADRPQSVGIVSSDGGQVSVVFPTLPAKFPKAEHVTPENVVLAAEDGVRFHNQLFLPKGLSAGDRRPAVVFVHGGPQRQMLLGYHYRHFYHVAYGVNQWLASQGYIVLSVNYRSGIGYGRSFRTAQNTGGRGNAEYLDVLAAGKYLQQRADVDPKRIGIWGLSYGGILTAQALARNSDIYAAGVDLAGIHLWGNSIDPKTVSYQSSSISQMDKWKSPVLLVHGDDDRNVAFSQTTGLVQLLRAHGIYHELIVFPDDVHDSLLYSRWIYTFDRMNAFLGKFLKNGQMLTTR